MRKRERSDARSTEDQIKQLHELIQNGSERKVIESFLEKLTLEQKRTAITTADSRGWTALHLAVRRKKIEVLPILLGALTLNNNSLDSHRRYDDQAWIYLENESDSPLVMGFIVNQRVGLLLRVANSLSKKIKMFLNEFVSEETLVKITESTQNKKWTQLCWVIPAPDDLKLFKLQQKFL